MPRLRGGGATVFASFVELTDGLISGFCLGVSMTFCSGVSMTFCLDVSVTAFGMMLRYFSPKIVVMSSAICLSIVITRFSPHSSTFRTVFLFLAGVICFHLHSKPCRFLAFGMYQPVEMFASATDADLHNFLTRSEPPQVVHDASLGSAERRVAPRLQAVYQLLSHDKYV